MRLNLDCVRDILLCVEENTGLKQYCIFLDFEEADSEYGNIEEPKEYQNALCKLYDNDEIIYHIYYCVNAGLLVKSDISSGYKLLIADLTPQGHELLGNIRTKGNWEKTKQIILKAGASGLNIVSQTATGVAIAYIKQNLGLS